MPLPALHLRLVQAIVKIVNAPDLSLRGRFVPVAISGRHLQPVQTAVKTARADCVCSGAHSVKSNMVYSGVRTWYTIHSLAIFR